MNSFEEVYKEVVELRLGLYFLQFLIFVSILGRSSELDLAWAAAMFIGVAVLLQIAIKESQKFRAVQLYSITANLCALLAIGGIFFLPKGSLLQGGAVGLATIGLFACLMRGGRAVAKITREDGRMREGDAYAIMPIFGDAAYLIARLITRKDRA